MPGFLATSGPSSNVHPLWSNGFNSWKGQCCPTIWGLTRIQELSLWWSEKRNDLFPQSGLHVQLCHTGMMPHQQLFNICNVIQCIVFKMFRAAIQIVFAEDRCGVPSACRRSRQLTAELLAPVWVVFRPLSEQKLLGVHNARETVVGGTSLHIDRTTAMQQRSQNSQAS